MSLWVDKHRPKDFSKLDYHREQASSLKKLIKQGDFPHLLVYGPPGAGKKTRVMCLLRELYGAGVERLRMEHFSFQTPSNKKLEIMTVSSNYHIEANPSDVGIYDRLVVMELIKKVAQAQQIEASGQKSFKVFVLTDVDELTKDAQHALRRTMEKFVSTCRLVLVASSVSKVTPAIRSRCLAIRVPAPTVETVSQILVKTCRKEGLTLPPELADSIAEKSGRNLRRALLMCEACKVQQYPFAPNQTITEPDWQVFIRELSRKALMEQSVAKLGEIRNDLYELIVHGIPAATIFKEILREVLKNCDMQLKTRIVEQAALYEHRMQHGNKQIFHLEAFIAKFMAIYKKYMEDAMGM